MGEEDAMHYLENLMEQQNAPMVSSKPEAGPAPWLRIHMLGRFQIDWFYPQSGQVVPLPTQKLHGQNAGAALGLLKALLSCPDRFATRAWLNEQFWPNSRHRRAEERLNDVVSSLRALLRPDDCTEMFVYFVHGTDGRGAGFRLDAYPQLWCDADAFEWYVKHAMLLDQRGQDSTACWERAYLLAERGLYLPEQLYEEWAKQKREYLNGLVRDCIHRWTALLRHMGHVDEAIMRLRAYWLEHLTDEDTLRPLLELLGEQERFEDAEEYYTRTQAVLAEDNHALDARTAETIESIRALQVSRRSSQHQPSVPLSPSSSSSLKAFFTNHLDHFQGRMLSQSYSGEQHLKHSRRQVLSSMVTSAYTMLTLSPYLLLSSEKQEPFLAAFYGTHPLNRTIVADLGEITKKYWKLSTNLSVPLLSGLQGHFQSIMHLLKAPHASVVRPELFSLASEAAQLLGKTLCDLRDYSLALSYYSFAVTAALEAKNNDLRAVALGRIALLFLSLQQPRQALACLQETRNTQSLKIRSWCAAIEAEAYSCVSESELCQHSLETARYAAEEV